MGQLQKQVVSALKEAETNTKKFSDSDREKLRAYIIQLESKDKEKGLKIPDRDSQNVITFLLMVAHDIPGFLDFDNKALTQVWTASANHLKVMAEIKESFTKKR